LPTQKKEKIDRLLMTARDCPSYVFSMTINRKNFIVFLFSFSLYYHFYIVFGTLCYRD